MFCSKCGDPIEANELYCNKCGNYLGNYQQSLQNQNDKANSMVSKSFDINENKNKSNNKMIFIGVGVGLGIVLLIIMFVFIINKGNGYYFSGDSYNDSKITQSSTNSGKKSGKYSTVIITDNQLSGVKINSKTDAYDLISKDSVSQKNNCPSAILKIENDIIDKYGITAVNLCEMDIGFAKEMENVFKKIYTEYPSVRGYITNLSLINVSMSEGYIAAFMPVFQFATADTSSSYPWVIKTQVLLNSSYFLNPARLESSVKGGSSSGHFPPNSTIYSPVAHELGHYLSFLALMKHYNMESILLIDDGNVQKMYNMYADFGAGNFSLTMIKEAYENCKRDTNTKLSLDDWRATISNYAVTKDNQGNYIYDETIAESFHDVYLNGDKAKEASKYIVSVLKKYLER